MIDGLMFVQTTAIQKLVNAEGITVRLRLGHTLALLKIFVSKTQHPHHQTLKLVKIYAMITASGAPSTTNVTLVAVNLVHEELAFVKSIAWMNLDNHL